MPELNGKVQYRMGLKHLYSSNLVSMIGHYLTRQHVLLARKASWRSKLRYPGSTPPVAELRCTCRTVYLRSLDNAIIALSSE